MAPLHERLNGGHCTRLKIDEWLVVNFEFVFEDCLAQVIFQRLAGLKLHVHLGFEDLVSRAAGLLCPVERDVGILQEPLGIVVTSIRNRDANADADMKVLAVELEWGSYDLDKPSAELFGFKRLALYRPG